MAAFMRSPLAETSRQSHELHPGAGQLRVFAGDAAQVLDSSSDSGLLQALTAASPGKAGLLHEASQADGIHAIAPGDCPAAYPRPGRV
jgi:hypothetical protein